MDTSIIENIIPNIILIIFPLLIYLVCICCRETITKSYNQLILNIALFTSLYLCLRYGTIINSSKILLFCNIPIVISYLKKKPFVGVVLSIINIAYCYFMFHTDNFYIITGIKYLSYFILYLCANKRRLSSESFILSIAVLQGFFLSFEYFFKEVDISINDFLLLLILVFIYYFVTFFVVYIFKITERVQSLNTSIKKLEKDKVIKDALFKLTHEVKNPLAVCKGYLDMIDIDKKDKANKYIMIMKQEINRSLNIMSDFLEFNKIKVVKETFDLNLLLDDVYDCIKIIVKNKNIKLEYIEQTNNEVYINGDYERLKQVLINLIKNSYEAITEEGLITISSEVNKNHINIIVKDNGIGMDEETLNNVKEMFYTTKKTGTGLGVALSNEIIKAHNGELIYNSKPNIGTKVTIRLPYV